MSDWFYKPIGSKASLAGLIHDTTSIRMFFLVDRNFVAQTSVAEKFPWASKYVTTRVEDEAYSFMGLFGVVSPSSMERDSMLFEDFKRRS